MRRRTPSARISSAICAAMWCSLSRTALPTARSSLRAATGSGSPQRACCCSRSPGGWPPRATKQRSRPRSETRRRAARRGVQAQLRSLTQTAAARLKDADMHGAMGIILEVLPHPGAAARSFTPEALNVFHEARAADAEVLAITGHTDAVRFCRVLAGWQLDRHGLGRQDRPGLGCRDGPAATAAERAHRSGCTPPPSRRMASRSSPHRRQDRPYLGCRDGPAAPAAQRAH